MGCRGNLIKVLKLFIRS